MFGLLSKAIFLLSQDSITEEDINEAERCLVDFVTRFQHRYGPENMLFNVHMLLHLPRAVRKWGGLQIHSTFPFESLNGKFKKYIKSAKGAINQIVERYLLSSVVNLLSLHPELDDEVLEELDFILTGNRIANPERVGNVYLFDSVSELQLLRKSSYFMKSILLVINYQNTDNVRGSRSCLGLSPTMMKRKQRLIIVLCIQQKMNSLL